MAKAYRIETDRLIIRCYQPNDAYLLKQAIDESIDHLLPWMPWAKHEPESIEKKIARIRKFRGQFDLDIDYTFGIFSPDEKVCIGSTGLHPRVGDGAREIGYWISASQIGKGYASETVKALTKIGFANENLDRIEIHCDPENIRSQSIPQKLGYIHEASLRHRMLDTEGLPRDLMIWTMFREDYQKSDIAHFPIKAFDFNGQSIKLLE